MIPCCTFQMPGASYHHPAKSYVPLALGVILILGGIFLTLAAYRVLPHRINPISAFAQSNLIGPITIAVGITLIGLACLHLRRVVPDPIPCMQERVAAVRSRDIGSLLQQHLKVGRDSGMNFNKAWRFAVYTLFWESTPGEDCTSKYLEMGDCRVREFPAQESRFMSWLSSKGNRFFPVTFRNLIHGAGRNGWIASEVLNQPREHPPSGEIQQLQLEVIVLLDQFVEQLKIRYPTAVQPTYVSVPARFFQRFKEIIISMEYDEEALVAEDEGNKIAALASIDFLAQEEETALFDAQDDVAATQEAAAQLIEILQTQKDEIRSCILRDEPLTQHVSDLLMPIRDLVYTQYYLKLMGSYTRAQEVVRAPPVIQRFTGSTQYIHALEKHFKIDTSPPSVSYSCAFVAVARALVPRTTQEMAYDRVATLRRQIADELTKYPKQYVEDFEQESDRGTLSSFAYAELVRSLRNGEMWMEGGALRACSRVLGRPVAIYAKHTSFALDGQTGAVLPVAKYGEQERGEPIHLFFDGSCHYAALWPR